MVSERMTKRLELLVNTLELRRNWARGVALCSGSHKRLGANCVLQNIPSDVLRRVLSLLYSCEEEFRIHRNDDEDEEAVEDDGSEAEIVEEDDADGGVDAEHNVDDVEVPLEAENDVVERPENQLAELEKDA